MTRILLLLLLAAVQSHAALDCLWVGTLNCTSYPTNTLCGSDGRDYQNRCYMAKAQCLNPNLHTVGEGSCSHAGVATHEPIVGREINHDRLLDLYCLELKHEGCRSTAEVVCGSDRVTYVSFCEFEKQKCAHRTLQVKNFGPCV